MEEEGEKRVIYQGELCGRRMEKGLELREKVKEGWLENESAVTAELIKGKGTWIVTGVEHET